MPSVRFDLDQIDHLLSTTRAVRRRLDLERPVPDDVLLRCIDLAEQAPTGGNQTNRRWLVIKDPETKRRLADLYREVGLPFLQSLATRAQAEEGKRDRVFGSALYLAENLERVPALVMVTIRGKHDGSGPGIYDSVLQSAWSFCLAARARGLGTAWTTLHLNRAAEVAELLAIPEDFTQVVLFPVAWTDGGDFRPAPRRPASEITYFDQWGLTRGHPSPDGTPRIDGCGVTVDLPIGVAPERVWDLIVDPGVGSDATPGGIAWAGAEPPGLPGSAGVTGWDPPRFLGWCAPEAGAPDIQWELTIEPILLPGNPPEDGSLLVYSATLGAGSAQELQAGFQRALRDRMQLTVAQIRTLAEDMRPGRG